MPRTLQEVLNEANPNVVAFAEKDVGFGDALNATNAQRAGAVASDTFALPDNAKAAAIQSCWVRAGGSTGYFPAAALGAAPGAGQVGIGPNGDIIFNAGDAVTDAEVVYTAVEGPVVTSEQVEVAGSAAALLASKRGAVLLTVELTESSIPAGVGPKAVVARASAPAAGEAALDVTGENIAFNAGDVVTGVALVSYVAQPGEGTGVPASVSVRLQTEVDY